VITFALMCAVVALVVSLYVMRWARKCLGQMQRDQHEYIAQAVRKERTRLLLENEP
jgi:hypothetical protein